MRVGQCVGVPIVGDVDGGVAEELLDVLAIHAHYEQQRVTQVCRRSEHLRSRGRSRSRIDSKQRVARRSAFIVFQPWWRNTRPCSVQTIESRGVKAAVRYTKRQW